MDKKQFGFRNLLSYATPWRGALLFILLLMLCESGVALLSPWLAGRFAEVMLAPSTPAALPSFGLSLQQILLCWLVVLALKALLGFFNQYMIGKTGETMLAQLRSIFFFALDQKLHVDRQRPCRLHRVDGHQVREKLTLIVVRAACINRTVADHRLERIAIPQGQRSRRLNVIMAVE